MWTRGVKNQSSASKGPHWKGVMETALGTNSALKAHPTFSFAQTFECSVQEEAFIFFLFMTNQYDRLLLLYRTNSNKVHLLRVGVLFLTFPEPHPVCSYLIFTQPAIRGRYSNIKSNYRKPPAAQCLRASWCLIPAEEMQKSYMFEYDEIFDLKLDFYIWWSPF